jgi:proteasome-associated ATPase
MSLGPDEIRARRERDVAALLSQISYLEEEIGLLRRKVADSPRQVRILEERIAEAEGRAAFLSERNDKLAGTLREAREQLITLKEEVDRLGQPPSGYGIFLARHSDDTVDVFTGGRKLRVSVSPNVEVGGLRTGQEVMLNEAMNVVEAREFERAGDVVMLKELLEPVDGVTPRALVIGHTDEERVVFLADSLTGQPLRVGD